MTVVGHGTGENFLGLGTRALHFAYYHLATGLGTGFSPVSPGTAGSFLAFIFVIFFFPQGPWSQLFLALGAAVIGVYAGQWYAEAHGEADPSEVVIDEIAGIFFTFMWLPFYLSWDILIMGFILFRIFDIWKPLYIKRGEQLPGGWGIMIDDVFAGLTANVILQIWLRFF